jgi:outer membrane protein TolC
MSKNKFYITIVLLFLSYFPLKAQVMSLNDVLEAISKNNPQLKMFDVEINSMDALAPGSKSWMSPQVAAGTFMTPFNPKMLFPTETSNGMGSYMIGFTQMFPNKKEQNAAFDYMNAMSSVEKEGKNYALNQLTAMAKSNYYQWQVLQNKIGIAEENLALMGYMIKSIEIRYQYNMDNLPTYYKAIAQLNSLESMLVMLRNEMIQKRIALNTLMARDKKYEFQIDSTYNLKNYESLIFDEAKLLENRSDLKAIDRIKSINELKINLEKTKYLPEFGIRYDKMLSYGKNPMLFNLMAMVTIPMPWSTKMNAANINSLKLKNEALNWQKDMVLNETNGMLSGMNTELVNLKKQYTIANKSIIPAIRRNYETALLAWQNNTGYLFEVLDGWEALNMAQIDALDKLQDILNVQVQIEKQLEIK